MPICNLKNLLTGMLGSMLLCSAASAGQPASYTDYARVVQVERSFRTERVREPQRVCKFVPHRAHGSNGQGQHNKRPGRYTDNYRRTGQRRCTTTTLVREHQVANGYHVTYVYRGNRFQTHTQNHPGQRIPVTITISANSR